MEPNKRNLIIGGVIAAVVVVGLAWWGLSNRGGQIGTTGTGSGTAKTGAPKGQDSMRPENAKALQTVQGGTREVVQTKIATPGEGATSAGKGVAVPTTVVQTGPAAFRHFDISASGNDYSPNIIVVNEGDVIDLNFTAVDKGYDIFFSDFGIYKAAAKGELVKLQFQGNPYGEYKFYCKDSCGGAKVEGKLIVNKK
ncbi:MAG: cupredoxin domain-containing protein [Patescibacteria group bacterium]